MPTQVQTRRGTTAQHSTFTGASGELTVDTDKKTVVVHDGATAGGAPLLRENGAQSFTTTGNITLNAQADLRFGDSDSSHWVGFQGPATISSNLTWTLPSTDGTNGQLLKTNGSGTLSWTSPTSSIGLIIALS
ncbi:hypothetical protein EBT31_13445 [bacterium]|jgi:hypothetical protein|nr:hypothetical protein [bacterium]